MASRGSAAGSRSGAGRKPKQLNLVPTPSPPTAPVQKNQVDNINLNKGGTSADYWVRRLKRDAPGIAAAERAQHLARRKQIYEAMHPEAKTGGLPGKAGGGKAKTADSASFVNDTAKKTGIASRTIAEDVQIGTRLAADVMEKVKASPFGGSAGDRSGERPGPDRQYPRRSPCPPCRP